jgi:hypothetical protein
LLEEDCGQSNAFLSVTQARHPRNQRETLQDLSAYLKK